MKKTISIVVFLIMSSIVGRTDSISLYLENDCNLEKDYYYSHGTKITYTDKNGLEYSVGQSIYTPKNKTTLVPEDGDRPYAGWLYGGVSKAITQGTMEHYIELNIGIVGPSSYAYETQNFVHELINNKVPAGWDSQIKDEVAAVLLIQESKSLSQNKYYNAIPYVEGAGGNLMSYLGLGINFQLGYNVEQSLHNQVNIKAIKETTKRMYLFTGVKGKYVFNNIFLDGNTCRDYSYSVEREDWVGDFEFGICAQYGLFKFYITRDYRTKEFETQPSWEKAYDSLKISFDF